ncbi:hypothetical protein ABPG72_006540 [Tetrahymena utriculariae]
MTDSKIIFLRATGYILSSTFKTLTYLKSNITAGLRDPSKAQDLLNYGAQVIKADMGQQQSELATILANYDHLYVVTPGHIDRTKLTINAIRAAKQANIKYFLVISITAADNLDILFGRQFNPIEKELKSNQLTYGLLRLPMFIDNAWGNVEHIKTHNKFYGPIDGSKKFISVAVQDAELAAAEILQNPKKHTKKTYTITSDFNCSDEQAQSYTQSLGRSIKYVNGVYEGTKQVLLKFIPECQVDVVLELYKLVESQDLSQVSYTNDFNQITAANQANVQYLLVVSVTCANNQDVLFGRQFSPIEKELKASGLKYGLLRLPMFIDNVWGNNEPIRTHNTFYGPINGDKKFVTAAVQDAALAVAIILQNPSKHAGKTYTITSDYKSSDEQAQIFSQALGRPIKYVNAIFEGTKQALLKFMPEWQVDGVLDLYKLIEKNDISQVNHTNDFKKITGSQSTNHLSWMWKNFKAF